MEKRIIKGYAFVIISGIIYGFMPLIANYVYDNGVTPLSLVFFRNLFSLPVLAILAFIDKKTLKIPKKALPSISFIALFGGSVTPMLLFLSYRFIDSSTATVLHFVYPAFVLLIGVVFLKQKTNLRNIISVFLCVFGVAMFNVGDIKLDVTGTSLALVSGVTYAIYIVLVSRFKYKSEISGFLFGFYISLISSVLMFLICFLTKQLAFPVGVTSWLVTVLFAIVVNVGAVIIFQQGTFIIGGEKGAVLSTTEPITSLVVGIALLGEQVSVNSVIGAVAVITASILISASKNKE